MLVDGRDLVEIYNTALRWLAPSVCTPTSDQLFDG
jgi:hypothetical protein